MKTADQYFKDLEKRRENVVEKLILGNIPRKLDDLITVDTECIWHAGHCISDDPEKRILEEGYFLDPIRARAFQCSGCQRIAILSGRIHQHDPVNNFEIFNGLREGMRFKVQIEDCGHYPQIFYNHLTNELRTPKRVHDALVHYFIQQRLEKENFWNIERIYDTYICGDKVISIKEEPFIDCNNFKVTKSFTKAAMLSMIQLLLYLRPYHFIYGNASKHSFIFNSIPCEGKVGNFSYKSKNLIKLRDFSSSSIRTTKSLNSIRLVPDTPILDAIVRHAEARIVITHNHKHKNGASCPLYRLTYNLHGTANDIERARHIHFSEEINFSLNVYLLLCALMCIPSLHDKIFEDPDSLLIWKSIWPHGETQAIKVAQKLNHSTGNSRIILEILMKEDLYLEPFKE